MHGRIAHELVHPPPGILAEVHAFLHGLGAPAYRYHQLVTAFQRGAQGFEEVRDLPGDLRRQLVSRFGPTVLPLEVESVRTGEQVEKVLFRTRSGARVETVLSRYRAGWASVCVSTQAGCGLACSFCATGALGLERNLSADEICAQVVHQRWSSGPGGAPKSVAFMGMGEALANPNVLTALSVLTSPGLGGLSPRRITVSTVGLAPALQALTEAHPQVTLTLSVHSAFPEQRAQLIPLERRYSLEENLAILDRHVVRARRKTYLAYLLIEGVNDSEDHLVALGRLVQRRTRPELFHVSVIRYNAAFGADPSFRAPVSSKVDDFVAGLHRLGVSATRRQQFGADIDAACGQLRAESMARLGRRRPTGDPLG
ncbi:23S rRNA (adenine-C8)-methyltransferase [Myxococcus fulvus]|uniref:23S rRNA (Adenine-C8)-methyltransferase n=1 Tax=Myxococcus fulvus TaxID=33 RepID=A0A511TGC9_MYXFU|nr:radical SAM protein [Myxococcus fulvus]GEN13234.1 ribosomal RNA large subunit methyltransferase Cfr [Myxococcus fulvus]SEU42278.1 23S rRNA (adenine-C8)-methyltransferase [Myxococcus fulvus]